MVRLPRGWEAHFHPQASRRGTPAQYRPGWRGTGMQPITATPITRYAGRITGVPLTGGQGQATVGAGGHATVFLAPQGLGTIWYPAQVTLSTTTGVLDTSTATLWLGALNVPSLIVGQLFSGNGTIALAIPSMAPGQQLIIQWAAGNPGDTAAANVIGTMDALTTG